MKATMVRLGSPLAAAQECQREAVPCPRGIGSCDCGILLRRQLIVGNTDVGRGGDWCRALCAGVTLAAVASDSCPSQLWKGGRRKSLLSAHPRSLVGELPLLRAQCALKPWFSDRRAGGRPSTGARCAVLPWPTVGLDKGQSSGHPGCSLGCSRPVPTVEGFRLAWSSWG
jgi:hypothetical protein